MRTAYKIIAFAALNVGCHAATVIRPFSLSSRVADGTTYQVLADQFDTTLGTLTMVTVQATAFSTGGSNTFTSSGNGSKTLIVGTDVSIVGPTLVPTTISLNPSPTQFQTFTGLTNGSVVTLNGTSSSDSDIQSATLGLTPYEGLGMVTFNITGSANTGSLGSAPGTSTDTLSNYEVEGTVTYTYTPVPEPSSSLMVGLVAMAVSLRRRRLA